MKNDTRKLAAIMFTDIVGYSRIMSIDEKHGMELLDTHDSILTPIIEEKNGKVLKKIGDAFFAEFKSAVEAVECAIQIQTALKEYNRERDVADKIIIRIGIHIGDVVVHGEDLRGEGINIAARLEPLAEPGGICLSQSVYQAVRAHIAMNAMKVGEVELKNILEKHVIYKIPTFYVDSIAMKELGSLNKPEKSIAEIRIQSIRHLPSTSRSTWGTALSAFLLLLCFITTVIFLGVVIGYSRVKYCVWESDIIDQSGWARRLKDTDDIYVSALRDNLRRKTLRLIDAYGEENPGTDKDADLSAVIKRTINDMNRQIRKSRLVLDVEILGALNLKKSVTSLIAVEQSERDYQLINRRILEAVFPSELEVIDEPRSRVELLPRTLSWLWADNRKLFYALTAFIVLYILVFSILSIFIFSLKSIKVTFSDMREVDKVISYFVEKLGFKPPRKEGNDLIFKARPMTVVIWNVLTIRARVDGNIIILYGPLIMINKLIKQLKTYSA